MLSNYTKKQEYCFQWLLLWIKLDLLPSESITLKFIRFNGCTIYHVFNIYIYDDVNDVLVSLLLSSNIFLTFLHLPIAAFGHVFVCWALKQHT